MPINMSNTPIPSRFVLTSPSRIMIALMVIVAASGCFGSGKPKTGSVTGKVTLNGAPLEKGQVAFFDPKRGDGATVSIEKDGVYKIAKVLEVGDYQVSVFPPVGVPGGAGAGKVSIPNKYQNPGSSGLSFTIEPGANEYNISME